MDWFWKFSNELFVVVSTASNQSIDQSINQSINQSVNQSINQSVNQSINQFMYFNEESNCTVYNIYNVFYFLHVTLTINVIMKTNGFMAVAAELSKSLHIEECSFN